MAWRGLHISRPARLKLVAGRMAIEQNDGNVSFPLEDIAWVILDTGQVTLTARLVAGCMEARIPIVFSDARHMPCGLALPFHQHHAQAETTFLQTELSAPFRKRAWMLIVKRKIGNQAENLRLLQHPEAPALRAMASHVRTGDPENVEARAARYYWPRLFDDFARGDEADLRNALLNYGYAVLRAAIARALCASGFTPALGLHHANRKNSFNLADDLIEAYRPIVDWTVVERLRERDQATEMTLNDRREMAGVLTRDIMLGGEQLGVIHAAERTADTLRRAMAAGDPSIIELPASW